MLIIQKLKFINSLTMTYHTNPISIAVILSHPTPSFVYLAIKSSKRAYTVNL